jgi:hypothetical protein
MAVGSRVLPRASRAAARLFALFRVSSSSSFFSISGDGKRASSGRKAFALFVVECLDAGHEQRSIFVSLRRFRIYGVVCCGLGSHPGWRRRTGYRLVRVHQGQSQPCWKACCSGAGFGELSKGGG